MKRSVLAITALLLGLSVTQPCKAETADGKLSVTPFVGGVVFDHKQSLTSSALFGIKAGYRLEGPWSVEADVHYTSAQSKKNLPSTGITTL